MCVSRVHQFFDLEILAILYFHICSHIQFSFHITLLIWNNIFIWRIYRGDLLYCVYSRSSPKLCFLLSSLSSLSSDSSWIFYFFIDCFPLQSFAMCPSLSHLKHFLVSFSFFLFQHSLAICLYFLQLKHFGFPSLKLSLLFPIFMGYSCSLYIVLVPIL